jgi:ComEC/Rec2-related protein
MTGEPTTREADERRLFAPEPGDFGLLLPAADGVSLPAPSALHRAEPVPNPSLQTYAQRAVRSLSSALILEWERGALFLLIAPLLTLGVIAYLSLPVEPALWALIGLVLLLIWACQAAQARPLIRLMLGAALLVVLGVAFARIETLRASTRTLGSEITTRLTGRVVEIDHLANGRIRLTVDVLATERPKLRFAPQKVRVSATAVPDSVRAGTVVTGPVRLFPPSGPLRPDSYDFSFESYFDGLGANGFFFRKPEVVTTDRPAGLMVRFTVAVDNFRNQVAEHICDAIGGAEGEIAAALVVGVRAGIPEPVNESLRRTGLAHILSISGLHMALVAASIMGVLRLGFAAFPVFSSRRAVKKVAAAAALVVVAAYLFVSGAEVAARRSFIMLAVMLVAILFDRAALTMRNLAIAAILTIAISPHEVVGPSFQMSFAATAALIGGYAAWTQYRSDRGRSQAGHDRPLVFRLVGKAAYVLAGIAATALIAGVATSIYGAWHFQRVSPLSLFANLAVTPIISIVMWCGLLATVAMPFGLDGPFLALMGRGLGWMLTIADWLSARSPLDAVGAIPPACVVLLSVALLVATLASTWLRWLALPFAACGLWLLIDRPLPEILISEDGRLVGVRQADGALAINRSRPNGFTVEDWQRATLATRLVKPASSATEENADRGDGFVCDDSTCIAQHPSGELVVHVEKIKDVTGFCETAALIVTADATGWNPCVSQTRE